VLQDVLTLDGRQFRNAAVIVASPPCQAYSYRGMPWGAMWREHNRMDDDGGPAGNYRGKDPILNDLFWACFRIAREAGLPVIVENVKNAQQFVGPAAWHYGSFYLWGDVPALMPITRRMFMGAWNNEVRGKMRRLDIRDGAGHTRHLTNPAEHGLKGGNGSWFNVSHGERREGNSAGNPIRGDGLKGVPGIRLKNVGFNVANAQRWREEQQNAEMKANGTISPGRLHGKNSDSRKAASAQIAKIPFPLAQHIARVFKPPMSNPRP